MNSRSVEVRHKKFIGVAREIEVIDMVNGGVGGWVDRWVGCELVTV